MKTPMQEVYDNFNLMSDAEFKAWMLNTDMLEKEKDMIDDIIDIIDSENSGQSAEQRLSSIKEYLKTFNTKEK